jgi:hypothetical protein
MVHSDRFPAASPPFSDFVIRKLDWNLLTKSSKTVGAVDNEQHHEFELSFP